MVLTVIAEILAGETLITPGGCVDGVTACGHEPFLWQHWLSRETEEAVASGDAPETGRLAATSGERR